MSLAVEPTYRGSGGAMGDLIYYYRTERPFWLRSYPCFDADGVMFKQDQIYWGRRYENSTHH